MPWWPPGASDNTPGERLYDKIPSPNPTGAHLTQPAQAASMAWKSELLEKTGKNCSVDSRGIRSALGFALFGRKSPRCFQVFVDYFFLSAGWTRVVFGVFHGIFPFSLQSWEKKVRMGQVQSCWAHTPCLWSNTQGSFTIPPKQNSSGTEGLFGQELHSSGLILIPCCSCHGYDGPINPNLQN